MQKHILETGGPFGERKTAAFSSSYDGLDIDPPPASGLLSGPVRRSFFAAVCSWMLSALLHGTSLVALGLMQGTPKDGTSPRIVEFVELTASFAVAAPPRPVVQLASYQEPNRSEHAAAPALLPAPAQLTQPSQLPGPALLPEPQVQPEHVPVPAALPPPPPTPIVETQLFGVRGRGNRFVYVFDRSASMEGAPLAAAKQELLASLAALTAANQFQIIFYSGQPQPMPSFRGGHTMTPAHEHGKRQAAQFIGSILADGSTDHMAALQMALNWRPDVIFLLTDASDPQLSPAQLAAIRRFNRQTTIHTIEFGIGPPPPISNFLQTLAMENGGQHTYIDVTRLHSAVR